MIFSDFKMQVRLDIAVIGVAGLAYGADNLPLADKLIFSNVDFRKVAVYCLGVS